MIIKYLGTAAAEGWPSMFCSCESCKKSLELGGKNIRTRSQAFIDNTLLFDFPPDSYMHMLNYKINFQNIEHILITHSHQDHFYPQDITFRCDHFSHGITKKLNVYGNKKCEEVYQYYYNKSSMRFKKAGMVEYRYIKPFEPINIGQHIITALKANHNKNEDCYIYMVSDGEKYLLYGNDTGIFPEETWEYIKNYQFDLVSLDSTLLKHKDGNNHMGIEDNIIVKNKLLEYGCVKPNTKFVITHFSHNGELLHDEIVDYVKPYNFIVAYDGLEVEF